MRRKPSRPHNDRYTANILKFMTEHGHPGYEMHIYNAQSVFDEVQAEAGPLGHLCPITQQTLDEIDAEINEAAQAAIDRYQDWATD